MKKIIAITLLLLSGIIFAQKKELGKVTIDELNEKVSPIDSSAVAAYLIKNCDVKFMYSETNGFTVIKTYKIKIKIYKKEGYEWANQSIGYYVGSNGKDKLNFSNAATYNLVNGKIEKSKLKSDGEFEEKVNEFWARKKITLPNVKEGSVIEYEAQLESERLNSIDEWYFQSSIPVVYSELKTIIPEYFIYNTMNRGYLAPKITSDRTTKTHSFTSKERSDGLVSKTTFSSEQISYSENKTTFVLENIPALNDEEFVNNIKNYTAGIKYELASIQYPNQPFKNFSTDWETVVKSIYENEYFGPELNKTGYFEKDLDVILSGINSQEERIAVVFNFVKSRMNWNDMYGYSCNDGVKKAYQEKKGNVAEINLMLTSMLRYAGIEANPILISTRSNGVSLFPSRTAFDYVISGVELNNQVILLDATNKFSLPNILPIRDLNWFGRIIRKNGSSAQINLMPTFNSKDVINMMATIGADGNIKGKIRDQYLDYNAFVYRINNHGVAKESYIEKLEKRHQGLEIEEYEVLNTNDLSKPIVENYSFTSTNSVEIIGDKMYVSPFMFFATTENPFKQETREYPVDFVYPNQDKYNINLTIPEGYVVETLPQPKAVSMPEEMGSFKYNLSNTGNQIQIVFVLDINQAIIGSEYYDALKSFYKEMINKQTEKIVLKKV
ncbi:DUF3857 domain-containing protein [Flavobacterium sp. 102]|uniref:DUF3858 domain-containing protein n=1 Tax=Flavobacterium sp. 102 TaxID=2135623 RepID=UPI000EB220D5|nr:DUF3857 domain-containing protein [Flavobacterium sp. 102]RKS01580.1 uncharacterized protein DUF3858 [Flavobacterium sp. 102]